MLHVNDVVTINRGAPVFVDNGGKLSKLKCQQI